MSIARARLFLIIGPSGVGKGTTVDFLKKNYSQTFVFPVSATTRPPRPGEKEGETYYFLSEEDFRSRIKNDEFLEWAEVHNSYLYGTLKKPIFDAIRDGKNVVRELDIQGFESVQKILPRDEYVSIFLLPPSLEVLERRIRERSPLSDAEVEKRMESAKIELEKSKECHYLVQTVDRDVPGTLRDVLNILKKEIPELEE
ncbi:guanylate kinase [Candidatus Peregrinibacteria bacterium]|nr:guanylate kinase [Candidatus Peregrinibacteria bacterium]